MGLFVETMLAVVGLMLAGVPIAFSLAIVSVAILILKGYPLGLVPHMIITGRFASSDAS